MSILKKSVPTHSMSAMALGLLAMVFGVTPILLWISFLLPSIPSALVIAMGIAAGACAALGLASLFRQPRLSQQGRSHLAMALNILGAVAGILSMLLPLS